MKKFLLFCLALVMIVSANNVQAQERTVTGKVTSVDDGQALPGVNVVLKGTSTGTVTDIDGNYTINVPGGTATLVFSFIGLTSEEVEIGSRSVIDIQMTSDVTQLSEVVVTAYGTTTKKDFTGSAQTVGAEDLALRQVTNPLAGLEGNVSGVQFITPSGAPGASPEVIIRGVGNLGNFDGATDPLIILDGIQFSGNLNTINQNDIETFTVLKDAASTSLYGSRAANGVIMITTKKGIKGKKTQVNYSSQFSTIGRAYDTYETTNAQQYYELMWEAYKNALATGTTPDPEAEASATIFNRLGYNPFNVANDDIVRTDGTINPDARVVTPGLDWFDAIERQGSRQSHDLTVSGGTENSTIFFSAGYLKEEGYIVESDFERISTRLRADFDVNDWLTLGGNLYISLTEDRGPTNADGNAITNVFGWARDVAPIYPVWLVDPSTSEFVLDVDGNRLFDRGEGDADLGIGARPFRPGRHALEEQILNDINDRENAFGLRAYADIDIPWVEGLGARITFGRDYQNIDDAVYINAEVGDAEGFGRLTENKTQRITDNFVQLLTYKRIIADDHNLDITLGHESFDFEFSTSGVGSIEQVAQGIFEFDNFSLPQTISGRSSEKGIEGYFARFNYNYKNKYYLSLSGRRDGSSVFDESVRWGNFYSIGGSWRLSAESFMQSLSFLDDLTFRASYGEVGNDNLNDFFISQPRYGLTSNAAAPAIFWEDLGNQTLTWETIENMNIGLDFSVLNNRISGTVEYYQRNSTDLLFDVPISPSNGFEVIPDNVANMRNDGFEVTIRGSILRNPSGLNWDLTGQVTTQSNEILDIPNPTQNGTKRWDEGRSRYEWYIWHTAGVDPETGDQLYYVFEPDEETGNNRPALDADGNQLTTNDWNEANRFWTDKNSIPDLFGSITNRLSYKGFSLNVLFTFQQGGWVRDGGYGALMHSGDYGEGLHVDALRAWRQPGDITDVPRLENGNATQVQVSSTRFLTKSDFITLRNINLSYSFDASLLEKINLNSLSVFVSGENLWLNTERTGLNAQFNLAGTGNGNGYDPARLFTVGLNVGL
ncbi:MAG: SusC/RagA family TonB-linked outer membrane protein [Bacteroidota bacterium]